MKVKDFVKDVTSEIDRKMLGNVSTMIDLIVLKDFVIFAIKIVKKEKNLGTASIKINQIMLKDFVVLSIN